MKWKDIYWKIWARLVNFDCQKCESKFVGSELSYCRYHPSTISQSQKPKFQYGSNKGTYPCCGAQALRINTHIEQKGCQADNHVVKVNSTEIEKDYHYLVKHRDIAVEPFHNSPTPTPDSLHGLLELYMNELKQKR